MAYLGKNSFAGMLFFFFSEYDVVPPRGVLVAKVWL